MSRRDTAGDRLCSQEASLLEEMDVHRCKYLSLKIRNYTLIMEVRIKCFLRMQSTKSKLYLHARIFSGPRRMGEVSAVTEDAGVGRVE